MMDPLQFQDLPQVPVFADDQPFYYTTHEHFGQAHTISQQTIQMFGFREEIDENDPYGHGALNMQPMQRYLQGMDPSPYSPGLLHTNLPRIKPFPYQIAGQHERPWPSADYIPYLSRNGSPDRASTSGTSSHAPQNELCTPHTAIPSAFESPVEFDQHRMCFPSPELLQGGGYSTDVSVSDHSINLRDLELHHEEKHIIIEGHDHGDTQSDMDYEQEPVFVKIEAAPEMKSAVVDSYRAYPASGMGSAIRDAEEVQPMTQNSDSDSDYKPSISKSRKRRSTTSRSPTKQDQGRRGRKNSITSTHSNTNSTRIAKRTRGSRKSSTASVSDSSTQRPFPCLLAGYGCHSEFASKNEWKRHISTQHIKLGFWRCDLCATTVDPNDDNIVYHNDFNRKDLFTQHLRRMHAAPTNTSTSTKQQQQLKAHSSQVTEENITEHQSRCYTELREPPPKSNCLWCDKTFEGPSSWEERIEHLGRHLEKDTQRVTLRAGEWREDRELEEWLVSEGLVERERETGVWRIGTGKPRRGAEGVGDDS